ncbi:type II toxin-antitoxin system RelE/ParE family toxin [Hymenobacter artigasi]|uniref:mRNA-degrading endonuclease RelE of RelBE toxin-antitoxin system n=1 Tax=Hymenobacter artigasi TaxID=2719616 RepID=A0ABX1HPX4_9BACT|nr:type II toxin-antitoxin system RelE/ParE family toxin [Hymenobacter artigasi]NKI91121.1 mRNA-degrading endonuclease RelE of RelBE toxin-antitoxin system [Hymenobacter artigasi]
MSFAIKLTPAFARDAKRLSKKFRSLPNDLDSIILQLREQPQSGTPIGHHCYKIRLAIASKGGGKSGGARLITYVQVVNETVFLLALYDKSEQSSVSDQQVLALLDLLEE